MYECVCEGVRSLASARARVCVCVRDPEPQSGVALLPVNAS